jgi:predicted RNA-binding protein (TIGR00451 family)
MSARKTRYRRGHTDSSGRKLFAIAKLSMSLDYVFGRRTSKNLKLDNLGYEYSKKTGRLRYVFDPNNRKVLFSFRPNGSIAPTIEGAKLLMSRRTLSKSLSQRPRFTVTVLDGVSDFVSAGRSVFCKHIVSCDESLRPGEDVIVLNEEGKLLAVGKTILPCALMKQFKRGVAVKIREGIKEGNGTSSFVV